MPMDIQRPKVSIVIPVYNVEKYLDECLSSLIRQSLNNIEIICVNDGSTDSSPSILERYAKQDSRIKVISKPNSGYGHTMNMGIDAAAGEYVGIVESDDYVPRNMYEALYKLAEEHDVDFIKADFYRFRTENGRIIEEYNALTIQNEYYNRIINPANELDVFRLILNTWSGIYRRDFLNKYSIRHNETPGASYQDNGFWFQTLCYAKRAYFVNKPFYMNRRDNETSSVHNKGKVYVMCDEYDFIRNILNKNPELTDRFLGAYFFAKLRNYEFTYRRIGDEFKEEFLQRFRNEFLAAYQSGELTPSSFSEREWKRIETLFHSIEAYRIEEEIHYLKDQISALRLELNAVKNSASFRIGRTITGIPRRLRDIAQR